MRYQTLGDKAPFIDDFVRNSETTALVPGTPVIMEVDGTEDGLSVELPASGSATLSRLFPAGIVTDTINAGRVGNVRRYGFIDATYICRTRAATSDSFSTYAALAVGVVFSIHTVMNALSVQAETVATNAAVTLSQPNFVLAEAVASHIGLATATSLTLTYSTSQAKVFVRIL